MLKKHLLIAAAAIFCLAACQNSKDGDSDGKFSVPETSFNIGFEGGSLTIPVTTDQKCQVTLSEGADKWLHQQTKYSDDIIKNQEIGFTVDMNEGAERQATVTVSPVSGTPATVTVTQAASPSIKTLVTLKVNDAADVIVVTLGKGETVTVIPVTNLGADEASAEFKFESSDESVIKYIGENKFEAVAGGSAKAIVTVVAKPGKYTEGKAELDVKVYKDVVSWNVTKEWVDANLNNFGFSDGAKLYEAPGFNGVSVPSTAGAGTFQFYMVDRTDVVAAAATANTYKLTAKGLDIIGPFPGDYVLWTVGKDVTYPAGTQIDFSCTENQSGGQNAYWIIEYLDGSEWVAPEAYPVTNVKNAASELGTVAANDTFVMPDPCSFSYNIHNTTENATWKFSATLKNATKSVQIRQRSTANINVNNKWRNDTNSGNSYFAAPVEEGAGCTINVL